LRAFVLGVLGASAVIACSCGSSPGVSSSTKTTATTIDAGGDVTCALTSADGVKCWGLNEAGQLGDGTTAHRLTPVDVSGLAGGVSTIDVGDYLTCVLTRAGGVKCWGANFTGEVGDATTTSRLTPVDVSGLASGVSAIAAGSDACALMDAGGVKCWGDNFNGELGDGTTSDRLTPVAVSGLTSGVTAIAAGDTHIWALTRAGAVECWGDNYDGELGDGTTTERHTPVIVSGLASGVAAIAAGSNFSCALTSAGGVKCWGRNASGELGDGTTTNRDTPVAVSGLTRGVTAIAVGGGSGEGRDACALRSAGGVVCWGGNKFGQLGDGTRRNRVTPVAVSGLTSGVRAIAVGAAHSCALRSAGEVVCWGLNYNGQLGDGTMTDRYKPVAVIGFGASPAPVK
jgi:alpha-tubulin suppressor-like RCC1 family protein